MANDLLDDEDRFKPEDENNPFNDPPIDSYKDFEGNLVMPTEDRPLADLDEEYRDIL